MAEPPDGVTVNAVDRGGIQRLTEVQDDTCAFSGIARRLRSLGLIAGDCEGGVVDAEPAPVTK